MMRIVIFFFCIIGLIACSSRLANVDNRVTIKVDSIYVNEVEKSDTVRHEPMIVYYCTFKSLTDSTVDIQVQDYSSEVKPEANFYLINSKDTLNLYLATNKSIKVPSKGEFHFGLATNTFNMVDLFEKYGYSVEHRSKPNKVNEVEFFKKIARESFILFEWGGNKREIRDLEKIKVSYRDPNDNTVD
ncbi:MAG TPA: hypothetical protein VL443_07435 [Cyclobacteriaceae bacterium]|jgi:hypothetical protein|nr:hypothetical protein [Cyclobacteriaceae bacterium]